MTILELLHKCKTHNIEAMFKYVDFADCYKLVLTKDDQRIAKLVSDYELKRVGLEPLEVFDTILADMFEQLGVEIDE